MKVLLTGASGFIGSAVLSALIKDGHYVVAISRNAPPKLSPYTKGLVNFIRYDLLQDNLTALVKKADCSVCIHLAWIVEPGTYSDSKLNLIYENKTKELIKSFLDNNGMRFIFSGSYFEYGSRNGICSELHYPKTLNSLYAQCKLNVSQYILELANKGHSVISARIFHSIGKGERPERLFGGACQSIALKKDFCCSINNDISFDLIDIEDIAHVFLCLAKNNTTGIINIGQGKSINISQTLIELFKKNNCIDLLHFKPNPIVTNFKGNYANVRKLKAMIGRYEFKPIELSLSQCIQSYAVQQK